MICTSPALGEVPYLNRARPSSAQVISKTSRRRCNPFTRKLLRKPCPSLRSCTIFLTAAKKRRFSSAVSRSKSRLKRSSCSYVGTFGFIAGFKFHRLSLHPGNILLTHAARAHHFFHAGKYLPLSLLVLLLIQQRF